MKIPIAIKKSAQTKRGNVLRERFSKIGICVCLREMKRIYHPKIVHNSAHERVHKNMKSGHHKQACTSSHSHSLVRALFTMWKKENYRKHRKCFRSSGEPRWKSSLRGNIFFSLLSFLATECCAYRALSSNYKKRKTFNIEILINSWIFHSEFQVS